MANYLASPLISHRLEVTVISAVNYPHFEHDFPVHAVLTSAQLLPFMAAFSTWAKARLGLGEETAVLYPGLLSGQCHRHVFAFLWRVQASRSAGRSDLAAIPRIMRGD